MLSQMRQQTFIKIVLWAVVISFVATMVFVWGADFQGMDCSQGAAPQGQRFVAMVGESPIQLREFDQRYRQSISDAASQRPPGQAITEDERLRILDQVFDQMVNESLFQLEVDRLGLHPTEEEIANVLINDPPEFLRQQFQDENGQFNEEIYRQALTDPRINWVPIEDAVRKNLPFSRLQQIFSSQMHISMGEVAQEFSLRNDKIEGIFTGMAWRDQDLEDEDPGDEQLQSYLDSHPEDFTDPERYQIQFVRFGREASEEDIAYVRGRMDFLMEELEAGAEFASLARDYSDDSGTAENGGDLSWFSRGRMVPEFDEAVFALEDGDTSEPVLSDFGFHLIRRMGSRKNETGEEEIQASHILMKVEPSYATLDSVASLADTLQTRAIEMESLLDAGTSLGLEVQQPSPFGSLDNVEGLGRAFAISAVAARMEEGEVSRRFRARDADFVIQLLEVLPEQTSSLEDSRARVLRAWEDDQKKSRARSRVEKIAGMIEDGSKLKLAAGEQGFELQEKEFGYKDYLPGVGSQTSFHLAAYMMPVNAISGVIETPQGFWVLEKTAHKKADIAGLEEDQKEITETLLAQAQQAWFEDWLKGLKDRYEVLDFRSEIYN
ncbi:MAG: peptidylprolyl isomerase [Candidatus Krumholzibacteria bacterium]|jgi:peptidyl-prolyl cis-trans isomerase D|nr:peptidylprolyl isomerase [Candidatus Krumholzibacteria bacterium]